MLPTIAIFLLFLLGTRISSSSSSIITSGVNDGVGRRYVSSLDCRIRFRGSSSSSASDTSGIGLSCRYVSISNHLCDSTTNANVTTAIINWLAANNIEQYLDRTNQLTPRRPYFISSALWTRLSEVLERLLTESLAGWIFSLTGTGQMALVLSRMI